MTIHTFPSERIVHDAARVAAEIMTHTLAQPRKTLILLSGGSSIAMYQEMFSLLPPSLSFKHTQFGLTDERLRAPNHSDSNEYQLRAAGIITMIEDRGGHFGGLIGGRSDSIYEQTSFILAFVGIGEDGHTVGWLPTATAEKFSALYDQTVNLVEFTVDPRDSHNPFTHRKTITLSFMKKVDQVITYATGESKRAALHRFVHHVPPLHRTPALGLFLSKQPPILLSDVALSAPPRTLPVFQK